MQKRIVRRRINPLVYRKAIELYHQEHPESQGILPEIEELSEGGYFKKARDLLSAEKRQAREAELKALHQEAQHYRQLAEQYHLDLEEADKQIKELKAKIAELEAQLKTKTEIKTEVKTEASREVKSEVKVELRTAGYYIAKEKETKEKKNNNLAKIGLGLGISALCPIITVPLAVYGLMRLSETQKKYAQKAELYKIQNSLF